MLDAANSIPYVAGAIKTIKNHCGEGTSIDYIGGGMQFDYKNCGAFGLDQVFCLSKMDDVHDLLADRAEKVRDTKFLPEKLETPRFKNDIIKRCKNLNAFKNIPDDKLEGELKEFFESISYLPMESFSEFAPLYRNTQSNTVVAHLMAIEEFQNAPVDNKKHNIGDYSCDVSSSGNKKIDDKRKKIKEKLDKFLSDNYSNEQSLKELINAINNRRNVIHSDNPENLMLSRTSLLDIENVDEGMQAAEEELFTSQLAVRVSQIENLRASQLSASQLGGQSVAAMPAPLVAQTVAPRAPITGSQVATDIQYSVPVPPPVVVQQAPAPQAPAPQAPVQQQAVVEPKVRAVSQLMAQINHISTVCGAYTKSVDEYKNNIGWCFSLFSDHGKTGQKRAEEHKNLFLANFKEDKIDKLFEQFFDKSDGDENAKAIDAYTKCVKYILRTVKNNIIEVRNMGSNLCQKSYTSYLIEYAFMLECELSRVEISKTLQDKIVMPDIENLGKSKSDVLKKQFHKYEKEIKEFKKDKNTTFISWKKS